ncbi:hypothetical protein DEU56DRAFT_480326 [Suillus clintonianus]|uniref:uncharacterized protein n=1 Tax=Suillus clintonianus TaxID=1904413 RepID=UPI001B860B63|nr:uncharacterized protein DEU56DRAFT_480326 [Suillus clintonianus]KAG2153338.1 hypothetical protein DEU56DRAFT_480326 [Suillus clintonianus]
MRSRCSTNALIPIPCSPKVLVQVGAVIRAHIQSDISSRYESNSGATDETTSVVPAPVGFDMQPSASGSHAADPVIIADESDASSISEISRPVMGVPTMEKDQRGMDKGEAELRRDAANREAEKLETERMEMQKTESATKEAERTEVERMGMERHESVTKEAETKKEPRVSPAANAHKLLRMERKLNNKDLVMGWYKSANSAELRYPHDCIAPKIGDVYVHSCKKEGHPRFQLWVRQISRGMTIWVKAHIFHIHPKLLDRRLTLVTTGEPYWTTRHSLSATGNRERAGKIAEMIIY